MYIGVLQEIISTNFFLHTAPNASVPEFTITCRTYGGPATTVNWLRAIANFHKQLQNSYQVIVDKSERSVYDNNLHVIGRKDGSYVCAITNNIRLYLNIMTQSTGVDNFIIVTGIIYNSNTVVYEHRIHYKFSLKLQESQLDYSLMSLIPTVHMSTSLCIGSHQVLIVHISIPLCHQMVL